MAQCSDCYNGCSQITSDRCVKYTGVDVPLLGIKNGDSLSYVEQALITFVTSVVDGSGIKINIDNSLYCTVITDYLADCDEITAFSLFKALIQAVCAIKTQADGLQTDLTAVESTLTTLNADYTVSCLEGVTSSSDTHAVVQALINKLCQFITDVETNYVLISDLDSLIQAYLDSQTSTDKAYTKMVPYTVVEYYGALSGYPSGSDFFDATGAGQGYWENIYLCNGSNGTPDKRGRSPIGAIDGVPGSTPSSDVNPASDPTFNQNYALLDTNGANKITLTEAQIPAHDHNITQTPHGHQTVNDNGTGTDYNATISSTVPLAKSKDNGINNGYILTGSSLSDANVGPSSEENANITIDNAGGGQAHSNVHPVIACYYIMYLP